MKKVILVAALLAAVEAVGAAATCSSATFNVYDAAGFNCTLNSTSGLVTFSNFTLDPATLVGVGSSPAGVVVPDTFLYVTPFGNGGDVIGFIFSSQLPQGPSGTQSFYASGSQLEIYTLRYTVSTVGAFIGGTRASITATDTCTPNTTQCGSASLTKDLFVPPPAPPSGGAPYATANVNDAQISSPYVGFAPVTSFGVRDTLSLQANNNSTTVTSFRNDFFVPEPATLSLAGLAFIGFALVGRRKVS